MTVRDKRVDEDLSKLRKLRDESPDLVESVKAAGNPVYAIRLVVKVPTPEDSAYPPRFRSKSTIHIELPSRYPLDRPKVSVIEPTWNPNIYRSGMLCLGERWIPTEGLDLLVIRIVRLLAFDSSILNARSPANAEALDWYQNARRRHPSSFPTMDVEGLRKAQTPRSKISWRDM